MEDLVSETEDPRTHHLEFTHRRLLTKRFIA